MEVVKKLSHREHILVRPDSYVGPTAKSAETCWVLNGEIFTPTPLNYSPALLKIFDEILVNAIDRNSTFPDLVKYIKVSVTDELITVENNGPLGGISVLLNEKENLWNPELTFGHLLTSTNYDDTQQRVTGGRNGYGAKLANVYSAHFQVVICDGENQKKYTQTWRNNMSVASKAVITDYKKKNSSVVISFAPDFSRFGMEKMDADIIKVIEKRAYEASFCTSAKCHVFFQGEKLAKKSPEEYVKMYVPDAEKVVTLTTERWSVSVAPSNAQGFQHVSFVNGIATTKGGAHVEHVASKVASEIIKELAKKTPLTPLQVKNCLFMVVRATLVNPTFGSQVKSECTSAVKDFGSRFEVTEKFIKAMLKTGIRDDLLAHARAREERELKKTDGKSRRSTVNVPKLEDATWAGTAQSSKCTLIVTEGDSAKTLAMSGLTVVGRETYGVFPLRGKCKNVRDASVKDLMDNKEFSNLKIILGLQQGKVYSSLNELRYGKLMIMTDADNDGSHIKGLLLNMIHYFWPSLLALNFVVSLVTPIIKATKGKDVRSFYTDAQFRAFDSRGWKVKYYKGLATSTSREAQEYFKDLKRLTVAFDAARPQEVTDALVLAFDKTKADDRKTWLLKNTETAPEGVEYGKIQKVTVSDFIHNDLVKFSLADLRRSVAHLADGLKPSQRKVMYACLQKKITNEIKVSQLASIVAEYTMYHHADVSLADTIVKMAQDFVGSNNINFLRPVGQFGSRRLGGKDAGQTRYINTQLMPEARVFFDARDDAVLKYVIDDGHAVEPEFFVPTMPTVLINGSEGIGTGYSCYIPPFNPEVIRANILRLLNDEPLEEMVPFYRGFKGTIERGAGKNSYVASGCYAVRANTVTVTELPPERWTDDFKDLLDKLKEENCIQSYENYSTDENIRFEITFADKINVEALKLKKTINLTNMHLFHPDGIRKYESAEQILRDYVEIRKEYYEKRKVQLIKQYEEETPLLEKKADFIEKVVNEKIRVFKRKRAELETEISGLYGTAATAMLMGVKTYEYTVECIKELRDAANKMRAELEILRAKSINTLWKEDLKN